MVNIFRLFATLDRFKDSLSSPYGTDANGNGPANGVVIDTSTLNDPLRNGATKIGAGIGGVKTDGITSFTTAKTSLLESIQIGVNRFLGFLALIALIYLIIRGIQLLLSPKDDEVKKIRTSLQNTVWAIAGIGFSWLIVTFLFWIVKQFVN